MSASSNWQECGSLESIEMLEVNARIQIWAKGFRVSEASSEFQLVLPPESSTLTAGEHRLTRFTWGEFLEPLYRLNPTDLASEFAVLLDGSDGTATVISAAHSEDRSGRRSIVVLGATLSVHWESAELGAHMQRARTLATRLAAIYAEVFRGCRTDVEKQLRDGQFVRTREFSLEHERLDPTIDWEKISLEMKRWKGITGIATKQFLALGANILLGTSDEAERARASGLDAYYDLACGEIIPLTSTLSLWAEQEPSAQGQPSGAPVDPLATITDRLERIEEQQRKTLGLLELFYSMASKFWFRADTQKARKTFKKRR